MPAMSASYFVTAARPLQLLMLAGYLLWLVTYVLTMRTGFLDKTFAIPWPNICLNIAWELYFGVLCPGRSWQTHGAISRLCPASTGFGLFMILLWLTLDVGNLAQLLIFGKRWQKNLYMSRYFYWILGSYFALGLGGQVSFIQAYHDVNGTEIAWVINLFMSIQFLVMFALRPYRDGLSYAAAWTKMAGNLAIGLGVLLSRPAYSGAMYIFLSYLMFITFLLDCLYIGLVHRRATGPGAKGSPGAPQASFAPGGVR